LQCKIEKNNNKIQRQANRWKNFMIAFFAWKNNEGKRTESYRLKSKIRHNWPKNFQGSTHSVCSALSGCPLQ
jgi:hypothetical protein